MKTQFILAAALSVLAFNTFAADGFDRTQSATFAEDGYSSTRSATFAADGYDRTHSSSFAEDGYSRTGSAAVAADGYDRTHSATFAEDGYDHTHSASFAEDGYDNTHGAQQHSVGRTGALQGFVSQRHAMLVDGCAAWCSRAWRSSFTFGLPNAASKSACCSSATSRFGALRRDSNCTSAAFGAGRPSAPELVMISVRLSTRCGAMAARCWAIIPPMLAPSTWNCSICKASIKPMASSAMSVKVYGAATGRPSL